MFRIYIHRILYVRKFKIIRNKLEKIINIENSRKKGKKKKNNRKKVENSKKKEKKKQEYGIIIRNSIEEKITYIQNKIRFIVSLKCRTNNFFPLFFERTDELVATTFCTTQLQLS